MKNFVKWLKAIFSKCNYVADRAYGTQLEQRWQHGQDLLSLSDIDLDEEEEQGRAADWDKTLEGYRQRLEPRRSTRSTSYTATTHHQGRARIDSDDDDGGGGARTAVGSNDIDWTDIQGDDE